MADRPLGVRLHNPLNVRPGSPWEGLAIPSEESGFCRFTSNVWGFRAAFRVLITYNDVHKLNTLTGIISRWAPPGDHNDTNAYIAAVTKATGYGADQPLAIKTWSVAANVVRAMTIQEQGDFATFFTIEEMSEGAFRAGIADAPPPLAARAKAIAVSAGSAVSGAAAIASPIVQGYAPQIQQSHSLLIQLTFGVIAVGLAVMAGIFHAKPKTAG